MDYEYLILTLQESAEDDCAGCPYLEECRAGEEPPCQATEDHPCPLFA